MKPLSTTFRGSGRVRLTPESVRSRQSRHADGVPHVRQVRRSGSGTRPFAIKLHLFLLLAAPALAQDGKPAADSSHTGILQAYEDVVLSSPVDELVAETPLKEGDFAEKDAVVLRLRDAEQQLELRRSAAVLKKAEFDASASKALFEKQVVAADKNLEQAVRHQAAMIECETAKIKAEERTLRSPIAGVVTKRLKDKGESVSRMEKVVEIMDIDRVFVLLNLPEDLRPSLQLAGPAQVSVPSVSGDETFEGKIDFVDPVVDPGSGLFRVKVLLENPRRLLRPGMRAHVRFGADAGRDTAGHETSGGSPSDSSNL